MSWLEYGTISQKKYSYSSNLTGDAVGIIYFMFSIFLAFEKMLWTQQSYVERFGNGVRCSVFYDQFKRNILGKFSVIKIIKIIKIFVFLQIENTSSFEVVYAWIADLNLVIYF